MKKCKSKAICRNGCNHYFRVWLFVISVNQCIILLWQTWSVVISFEWRNQRVDKKKKGKKPWNLFLAATLMVSSAVVVSVPEKAKADSTIICVSAVKGDDKNNGTFEKPFKTLQAAYDKAKNGDVIAIYTDLDVAGQALNANKNKEVVIVGMRYGNEGSENTIIKFTGGDQEQPFINVTKGSVRIQNFILSGDNIPRKKPFIAVSNKATIAFTQDIIIRDSSVNGEGVIHNNGGIIIIDIDKIDTPGDVVEITNLRSTKGAIHLTDKAQLHIGNAIISGNIGSGLRVEGNSKVYIYANAKIMGNYLEEDRQIPSNVYLAKGQQLFVSEKLKHDIGVSTEEEPVANKDVLIASGMKEGSKDYTVTRQDKNKFILDRGQGTIALKKNDGDMEDKIYLTLDAVKPEPPDPDPDDPEPPVVVDALEITEPEDGAIITDLEQLKFKGSVTTNGTTTIDVALVDVNDKRILGQVDEQTGKWSFTPNENLINGKYTFTVIAKSVPDGKIIGQKTHEFTIKTELVDKTALQKKVDESKTLHEKDYTSDSWKKYQEALAKAQKVLADEKATKEDVQKALELLTTMQNNLVKVNEKVEQGLKVLIPSAGTLSPNFSPDIMNYRLTVDYSISHMTFDTAGVPVTIKVNGREVTGSIPLAIGVNRVMILTADGKEYIVEVTRLADTPSNDHTENGDWWTPWTPAPKPEPEQPVPSPQQPKPPVIQANGTHRAYIQGFPDGTFGPNKNVTRAQVAVMIARVLVYQASTTKATNAPFKDIAKDHQAVEEITFLKERGIMNGDKNGNFRADEHITRAEMATLIANFKELTIDKNRMITFNDTKGHWAQWIIEANRETGIIDGYEDGSFAPNTYLTRAQAVVMINRMFNFDPLQDARTPSFLDVSTTHWAFKDIEKAATTHDYILKDGREYFFE